MIRIALLFTLAVMLAASTGCSGVNTALGGLAEKSLSGSGTVAIQRVGVDPDTAAPVLKSTVITGDYASAPEGTYALQYRRRIAPSIFNSASISHEVTINYIGTADRLADAVGLVRSDLELEQTQNDILGNDASGQTGE
ncbi:MAG: hypothetical protein IJT68_10330 [Lentisphaeria bacterium]|nr:hypothetical protein [Lentisphaeria bacterium]MBR3507116.1 hypothetical protein [Lentisphaeria bacterium]